MDDGVKILWGLGGSLATAGVVGLWKWVASKFDDRIRLTAKVSQPGDYEVMQHIGCASMIVTIKSEGKRVAKIQSALIALQGIDLTPEFEKAFGASFGHVPVKAGPPPALAVQLVPLTKPNSSDGFILERDDVVRFAMPIQGVPVLHLFPKASSQDVWIAVKFFDGTEHVVLRGRRIQQTIDDLITVWGNQVQKLNVTMQIELRTTSAVLPGNPELVGKTNPNPLIYLPDDTPEAVRRQLEAKHQTIEVRFPLFSLLAPDGSRAVMIQSPYGLLLPVLSTRQIAEEYQRDSGMELTLHEMPSLNVLRAFVTKPPTQTGTELPPFKIVFDTIDPSGRKAAVISQKEFLSTME